MRQKFELVHHEKTLLGRKIELTWAKDTMDTACVLSASLVAPDR